MIQKVFKEVIDLAMEEKSLFETGKLAKQDSWFGCSTIRKMLYYVTDSFNYKPKRVDFLL